MKITKIVKAESLGWKPVNLEAARKAQQRQAVRNFMLAFTPEELCREYQTSLDMDDSFRAECVRELIEEFMDGVCQGKWVVWYDGFVGWVYNCDTKEIALGIANETYGKKNYAAIPCWKM